MASKTHAAGGAPSAGQGGQVVEGGGGCVPGDPVAEGGVPRACTGGLYSTEIQPTDAQSKR